MTTCMSRATVGSDEELFLYEAALAMTFSMDGPQSNTAFERLFALADNRDDLRAVREASLSCAIPSGLLDRPVHDDDKRHDLKTQRRNFKKNADAVRNGKHLGWLTWAAQVYFSQFSDVDEKASPRERLVTVLGEKNAQTAIAGFIAALSRTDLPSPGPSCIFQRRSSNANSLGWRVLAAPAEGYQDISNTWLVHAFPIRGMDFRVCENRRHSVGLGGCALAIKR
jgi:hypothetical protein